MDADGNYFGADWYNWGMYAASQGWLVFRPNYRGSAGYGDKFALAIVPKIVSAPGRDILSGVAALVNAGIANPKQMTIGGYSYGGYMTNWLITQTNEFKAAVTGAGAVEHIANWGNDDTTYDDAFFLGGLPWDPKARQNYIDQAAIFQIDKVKTPTHIVAGGRRHSRRRRGRLPAGARAACAWGSEFAADLPRRRARAGPESVARQDQSARRSGVDGEVLQLPGEMKSAGLRGGCEVA